MPHVVLYLSALVLLATTSTRVLVAQMKMPADNFNLPVLASSKKGDTLFYASGFFCGDRSSAYFVTARHSLFDLPNSLKSPVWELSSEPAEHTDKENRNILKISLDSLKRWGLVWTGEKDDIAVVKIGQFKKKGGPGDTLIPSRGVSIKQQSKSGLLMIDSSQTKLFDAVQVGNEVYIMGYPRAIGLKKIKQIDYEKPLARRGIVAGKNLKQRTLILDCPVDKGNSGGPVIEIKHLSSNTVDCAVIGIVTEFIPKVDTTLGKHGHALHSNSGYSVAVPMDAVMALIRQH